MILSLRPSLTRGSLVSSVSRKALAGIATTERWGSAFDVRGVAFRGMATDAAATSSPSPLKVQLYQYAICPFCNKTKALMDYAGVDYQSIEVNPLTKAEIKW